MTALDMFYFEYGKPEIYPLTKLPRSCPKEYGYLADAEWCSHGANREDCRRCWSRELKDPFIAAQLPNYTPVDERKGYCDLGAFRLVIEDGSAVGAYCPGGLEADPATTPSGRLGELMIYISSTAEQIKLSVEEILYASRDVIELMDNWGAVG